MHFIFRHKNPISGEFEEKHLKLPPKPNFGKSTNLYTLHLFPNNTYDVLFNGESFNLGNLLEDFNPPVNPEKEIDDPDDKKPEDWVDEKRIADPDAVKVGNMVLLNALVTHGAFSPMTGTRMPPTRSQMRTPSSLRAGSMTSPSSSPILVSLFGIFRLRNRVIHGTLYRR